MDELGNNTRSTYRIIGLVDEENLYLLMDNVGRNGENKSVFDYSDYLEANYNILVHHQVPQSPRTNMVDIG